LPAIWSVRVLQRRVQKNCFEACTIYFCAFIGWRGHNFPSGCAVLAGSTVSSILLRFSIGARQKRVIRALLSDSHSVSEEDQIG
jgi:hypothetical protein